MRNIFKKKERIGNRKVTKARFLYLYIIFGSILGLGYFIASLFVPILPSILALSPIGLILAYVIGRFLVNNWKLIWLYVTDVERGRLLLYINKNTHWSEDHKLKVIKWVYLGRNKVRNETRMELINKMSLGKELTSEENIKIKFAPVFCPQQIHGDQAGFNEALLVNVLIYAHRNIHVLDSDLRSIMNLTDENIMKFNLNRESEKCLDEKYAKMRKIGERNSKRLNEE